MQNTYFKKLIKTANKIEIANTQKSNIADSITEESEIKFREFKLYYTLIFKGYSGSNFWFVFDCVGTSIFTILALLAFAGKNESSWFVYFKIISVVGAIYFMVKLFLLQPLLHTLNYYLYKKWIVNNSFTIIGWHKLANNSDVLLNTSWYKNCNIIITLEANCPQITKDLIAASSVIFINNANFIQTCYYDEIEKWELKEWILSGGANNTTLGCVYRFIKNDLNLINKTYGGITELEIKANENTGYVGQPMPSD